MGFPDKPCAHLLGANGKFSYSHLTITLIHTFTLISFSSRVSSQLQLQAWRTYSVCRPHRKISCHDMTYQVRAYAALTDHPDDNTQHPAPAPTLQ